ncbi:transcriptional regulator, TetR family [Amycolatopsis marina]|uniref:Transcriptional regulator, TetR family n=1 Tax=Amycolatopsis marina TaxID=490629 RepID=A0A1I1BET2_9PSEU|nr:TetR/AcrR family transcriptional regulator [Amycolatopsis marina]SFB48126.1 transcriptional regulator, TetR family [Amycolatopsis marina]
MTTEDIVRNASPRGTRQRIRRAVIIPAATDPVHRFGYDQVSMSDVAAAVNVGPSALYRHFASKPKLLTAVVVVEEMQPFREVFSAPDASTTLDDLVTGPATAAAECRLLGPLWQQEARSLPEPDYATLRYEVRATVGMLAGLVRRNRPECTEACANLLAQGVCSVMCSLSTRGGELPKADYQRLLRAVVTEVLTAEPAPTVARQSRPRMFTPSSRRERLRTAAIALFVAFVRGDEWLRHDMYRALERAIDVVDALRRLLVSYVDFAVTRSDLVDVLVAESRHLLEAERSDFEQCRRSSLSEWVQLVRDARARTPEAELGIRVETVLTLINDIAVPGTYERSPACWRP